MFIIYRHADWPSAAWQRAKYFHFPIAIFARLATQDFRVFADSELIDMPTAMMPLRYRKRLRWMLRR